MRISIIRTSTESILELSEVTEKLPGDYQLTISCLGTESNLFECERALNNTSSSGSASGHQPDNVFADLTKGLVTTAGVKCKG